MDQRRNSVHEVAKELANFLRTSWKQLSVRLWDRFDPGESLVWLVPSTKWPAYDHGKLFVQSEPDGSLLIGLYVEKGFAGQAVTVPGNGGPKALNKTWTWVPFFDQMVSGKLDSTALETTRDYVIQIDLSMTGHTEGYRWCLSSGQLAPLPTQVSGPREFPQLQDARSFKDLATKLQAKVDLDWFWIDMRIGLTLPPGYRPEGREIKAGLDPWLEWVR